MNSQGSRKRPQEESSSTQLHDKRIKTERAEKLKEFIEYGIDDQNEKFAKCKLCCQSKGEERIIKMKYGNTSGLMRHFKSHHKEEHEHIYGSSSSNLRKLKEKFEQKKCEQMMSELLVKKYLPFNFFDDEHVENLFTCLNPEIEVPKRNKMKSLVLTRLTDMQKVVFDILKECKSKISFTIDGWTSITNKSYCGITGHFFDDHWNLHSLVIDFLPCHGKHKGEDAANLFLEVLEKYGLVDKLQAITVDNTASNTTFLRNLTLKLNSRFKKNFNPADLHFSCFAHILHLAAQDLLKELEIDHDQEIVDEEIYGDDEPESKTDDEIGDDMSDDENNGSIEEHKVIPKLRNLFKKLRRSEQLREKLKCCCITTDETILSPNIDVSTRWNSTYEMVKTAIRMKKALNLLCVMNPCLNRLLIEESEWTLLNEVQRYLRHFKALTEVFSGDKYVTLPSVVVGFNLLLDKIENSILNLNQKQNKTMTQIKLIDALQSALQKLLKHYRKANWIYSAVLILDPRHKFVTFEMTEWGKEMSKEALKKLKQLFQDFYIPPLEVSQQSQSDELLTETEQITDDLSDDETLDIRCLYNNVGMTSSNDDWKSEIDRYLASPRADGNVDVAQWWSQNCVAFPNLSNMARDLLAIQATSVSSERLFSRAGLIVRKHRNRLNDDSIRACVNLNSWTNCSLTSVINERLKTEN